LGIGFAAKVFIEKRLPRIGNRDCRLKDVQEVLAKLQKGPWELGSLPQFARASLPTFV
jgi:hypothetical protein